MDFIQGALAAIHFVISNAAKFDVDDKVLIQEIQQLGLPRENTDVLAKLYRENRESLRSKLREESYRISKLVETRWRVDQVLAHSSSGPSSTAPNISSEKVVHLQFTVDHSPSADTRINSSKNSSSVKDLAFELSPEQLDLLIHELSQAQIMMQEMES